MKRLLLLFVLCWSYASLLYAQPYGNEWINYSNNYFKIKVKEEGLVRIPFSTLSSAGLSGLAGSGFKVFLKGQEIPIYVTSNATFGSTDYIEFYGNGNDGELDTRLFQNPNWQLHDYRSSFSDTIGYYLVWDNSSPGQRYQQTTNNLAGAPAAEPYFMHTSRLIHWNIFNSGKPFRLGGANNNYPDFEEGEGFCSSQISTGGTQTYNLSTPSEYNGAGAPNASFRSKLIGRSNNFGQIPDHNTSIRIGGTEYANVTYEGYETLPVTRLVFLSNISSPVTQIQYQSLGGSPDNFSVAFSELIYPRIFDFGNATKFKFTLNNNALTYLEIGNFNGGTAPVLYDLTNQRRYFPIFEGGVYKVKLEAGANPAIGRQLYLSSVDNVCVLNCTPPTCTPANCNVFTVSQLIPANFTNFNAIANQGNYIIITHPSLRTGSDWVAQYANHRASAIGGGHTPIIVNIEELYDQFAWGIPKHPLSIRNFINFAIDTWSNTPRHLFLIGKSVSYESVTNNSLAFQACLVPTWGHHPADNLLTVRDFSTYVPQIPVGRISANNPAQVQAYYEKMIAYDADRNCTIADREWTKKVIHVANGHTASETNQYLGYVNTYKNTVEAPLYGGNVVGTYTQTGYSVIPNPAFTAAMNDGAGIVTFIGHSVNAGSYLFDLKPPQDYNNAFKNPFMFFGSCYVGDVHSYGESNYAMAERYVLYPQKGAIGFLATVSFGFPEFLQEFGDTLYREFSNLSYGQTIGTSINNAMNHIHISDPANPRYEGIKITLEEYTLEGDPALVLVGTYDNAEYLIPTVAGAPSIRIFDSTSGEQLTGSPIPIVNSTVNVEVSVTNIGQAATGNIQITVQQQLPGGSTVQVGQIIAPAPVSGSTYTIPATLNTAAAGVGSLIVTIAPLGGITEDCTNNNQASLGIQVQSSECAGLPLPTITGLASGYCTGTGAIALNATPAGGSFTINGSAATTFNPTTLGAGAYIVQYTYTDPGTACVLNTAQTVVVTAAPNAAISASANSICLTDGQVTLSPANFVSGATYNWEFSGGNTVALGNQTYTVSWSTAGTKIISLTATQNGCTSVQETITITVESPLAIPAVTCGASTTSSVTFNWSNVAGATGYQVIINGTVATTLGPFNTTYTQSGLGLGESVAAQIVATGSGICGNSSPSALQACTAQSCAPITVQVENVLPSYCITANPVTFIGTPGSGSGGTGTFILNGETFSGVFDPAAAGIGTYTLQYLFAIEACEYSSQEYTFSVVNVPSPTISGDANICPGESTTLTASGGFTSYLWSTGVINQTLSVSPGTQTTYIVTVTNAAGCTGSTSFIVTPAPQANLTISTSSGNTFICSGQSIGLTASDGFNNYSWGTAGFGQNISVSAAGTYTVSGTDDFGCTYSASITLTPSSIVTPTILANGGSQTDFCSTETITLNAGAGYAAYNWSNGATTPTTTVSVTGLYSVTVTGDNGCNAIAATNISVTTINPPVIETNQPEICAGETALINASAGYSTYEWSNGNFGATISVTDAGTYTVTVSINDCFATNAITIGYPANSTPDAAFDLIGSNSGCVGSTFRFDNLSANGSSYLWTFNNTNTGDSFTSTDFEPTLSLPEGSYAVSLLVTNECSNATDQQTANNFITVNTSPTVDITTLPTSVCPGDEVLLEGTASVNTVQWFAGQVAISSNFSVNVKPNEETRYTLIATNAAGCAAADSVLISINDVCELPNAITPNGDGFNDTWRIPQAQSNANITVTIFNRWGQQVYAATAYNNGNGWDGTNNGGTELPGGTYYYIIDLNDGTPPLSGHITLLR